MRKAPRTVYEVLDAVRQRPGMFGVTSVEALGAFLSGLSYSDLDEGDPPHAYFSHWVNAAKVDNEGGFPLQTYAERLGRDHDTGLYFELLDSYRACECLTLGTITGPFSPNFRVAEYFDGGQLHERPELPQEILLIQFRPSRAHALLEVYKDDESYHTPFSRSLDEALSLASSRWGVPPSRWCMKQANMNEESKLD